MPLRYFNCPECGKATFIKPEESNATEMECEYCALTFAVGETRPFEMSVNPNFKSDIYGC